ncbi:TPA: hypothetical protein IAC10_05755 [Candidatus Scatousia excrementigallinarum]|uniref:Outer membrane lipoprotein carrier protein LolA n=1 Tax=Candidatus Scatousia excrementigallinarum TaxID=2840935 RepID=A0A9D1EYX3_9BACT|nr:hypothetical protein [Candidatus Scatousia excrementigallinarum]
MKKFLFLAAGILISGSAMAQDLIFQHLARPDSVFIPQYKAVACKFTQNKTIPNTDTVIESGGRFRFNASSGVVFETLYPVVNTTVYATDKDKKLGALIAAIARKDYTYLNNNFELFYIRNGVSWRLALKPKVASKASGIMESIIIAGGKYIDQIDIRTPKSGNMKINFTECSAY